jgi:hypothetical protein
MGKIIEILSSCSFSWEKLKEMKDNRIEFWAADGLTKLLIFEIDEKEKSFYVVNQLGKPLHPVVKRQSFNGHLRITADSYKSKPRTPMMSRMTTS